MKSILENRPALKAEIEKVAEVAGYLWQNGWAERNGGNITVNVTEFADASWQVMPALVPAIAIGCTLPQLKGKYFYAKGTQKLIRGPEQNGASRSIQSAELLHQTIFQGDWLHRLR